MIEYYLPVKHTHIALAAGSGGLFALRGLPGLLGQSWVMAAPLRYLSYGIDTALLAAALLLLAMLRLNPFTTPWLAVKLTFLAIYIVLGSLALKRARTARGRLLAYIGALACFGYMFSVARAHHPLGIFAWL